MYFDYYSVDPSKAVPTQVTNVELAKYIATDWMPGLPLTIMNGFADVLLGVLETHQFENHVKQPCDYWCVKPDLALTDRQWKGVTSWILGVAFTRFVAESAGYPWWSPVSAFKGDRSTGSTTTGNWLMPNPRSQFSISRKPDSSSTLYPDYLFCRLTPRGYAYAFCESKGTKKSIAQASWNKPPSKWVSQVKSLDLFFNYQPVHIAEHVIVATRVNPYAEQDKTRKVVVRAWDVKDEVDETDPTKFASFLASHYAAVCWRLGINELAQLMEAAAISTSQSTNSLREDNIAWRQKRADLLERLPEEYELLFSNNALQVLNGAQGLTIFQTGIAPTSFKLGDRLFEIALTAEALDIMRAIANFNTSELQQVARNAVNRLQTRIAVSRDTVQQRIAITLNGLAVFDSELESTSRT